MIGFPIFMRMTKGGSMYGRNLDEISVLQSAELTPQPVFAKAHSAGFARWNGERGACFHGRSAAVAGPDRLPPPKDEVPAVVPGWKRALDLGFVFFTLPAWLPLMLLIRAAIKAVSPGPVIYRQARVGLGGKVFMLYKFRSMKVNAATESHEAYLEQLMKEERPMTKLDANGDPRLIPLGRLLRASGLDELPQIFNVLRGEMSLVGARPCTVREFEYYRPWQRERVNGPPGLTGYRQVNGKNKTTFSEMIEMDIFYAGKMSIWLDLTIILRTVPALLSQVREARGLTLPNNGSRGLARNRPLRGSAVHVPTRSGA
jgi:lipopolysaccharide/colanic/teichoic acid biosynthesis glycosyltransferase